MMVRHLLISVAITLFVMIVRPFGVSYVGLTEILILLGLTPLNFLVMSFLHNIEFHPALARVTALIVIVVITLANTIYLTLVAGNAIDIRTGVKVGVVVLLAFGAISLWMREKSLKSEIIELRARQERSGIDPFILTSDNDREVLRIDPRTLLFIKADKNYVQIFQRTDGTTKEKLLRTSLKRILNAVPENMLLQCHRSFAVNLKNASQITHRGGKMQILFPGDYKVPVSRAFKFLVLESVKN